MSRAARVAIEIAVLLAIIGAFFYLTLASANAEGQNCITTCTDLGDGIVVCETVCN